MQLVRNKILKGFAEMYGVVVQTEDNKAFVFVNGAGVYLGRAQGVEAACAWMRGFGAALGYPIPGAPRAEIGSR